MPRSAGFVPVANTQQAFQRSGTRMLLLPGQQSISKYSARADHRGQLAVNIYDLVSGLTSEPAVGVSPATLGLVWDDFCPAKASTCILCNSTEKEMCFSYLHI